MKFLNVGGSSKEIPVPEIFNGWEHHLLDINPETKPDICADAKNLSDMKGLHGSYDAVYASHSLEHFYLHDVPKVLKGFYDITNDNGFCYIIVPNIKMLLEKIVTSNLELNDIIYRVQPDQIAITAHDMIYGSSRHIEIMKNDFYAHKCGFFPFHLVSLVFEAGFSAVSRNEVTTGDLGLTVVGYKKDPNKKD